MTRRPNLILGKEDRAAVAAWSRFNLALCGFLMAALLIVPMVYRTATTRAEAKATVGISARSHVDTTPAATINPTELTAFMGSLPVAKASDTF